MEMEGQYFVRQKQVKSNKKSNLLPFGEAKSGCSGQGE